MNYKNLVFICIFFLPSIGLTQERDKILDSLALRMLKPEFMYRYNLNTAVFKQTLKPRKSAFLNPINPNDTLLLKQELKNDTSDAFRCIKLFQIYRTLNKNNPSRFYSNKATFLLEQKLKTNPTDSAVLTNLALLYTENNYFEEAAATYKILLRTLKEKEMPAMMLAMIYMGYPDSVSYFIDQFEKSSKENHIKLILRTSIQSIQFLSSLSSKNQTEIAALTYKDFTDWNVIEANYQKNKNNTEHELVYNAIKTYLIILHTTITEFQLGDRYLDELKSLENYFTKVSVSKKYNNKLIAYLSLASIFTMQKRYDQAYFMQKKAVDYCKQYEITSTTETEDIINSCIGLVEVAKNFEEGKNLTKNLAVSNPYNLFYRKSIIYFAFLSNDLAEVEQQLKIVTKNHQGSVYPQLVLAYNALRKKEYAAMYDHLKVAYSLNPSVPEIYGLIAIMYVATGKNQEALMTIKNFEKEYPKTATRLKDLIK